jgi:enoyl-CoA hydratase/carnithine racemase
MSDLVLADISGHTGIITLNRPSALNSLTLDMVRTMTSTLLDWRDQSGIHYVMVRSSSEKAYCAGGDIRFFHQKGKATATEGAAPFDSSISQTVYCADGWCRDGGRHGYCSSRSGGSHPYRD